MVKAYPTCNFQTLLDYYAHENKTRIGEYILVAYQQGEKHNNVKHNSGDV